MANLSPLKLVIGGSREGADYRFIGDTDSLGNSRSSYRDDLMGSRLMEKRPVSYRS